MESTARILAGRKLAPCTALWAGIWAAWPRALPFRATPGRSIPCGTRVLRPAEPKEPRARTPEARQPLTAPSPALDPGCSQQEHRLVSAFPSRRTSNAQLVNARNSSLPSMENTSIRPSSWPSILVAEFAAEVRGYTFPPTCIVTYDCYSGYTGDKSPIGQLG